MKTVDPITRLTPGLKKKLISRTSLVARAIVSPTECRLWKVMLLPSRLTYNSLRISRSTNCPISSAPKFLPNCSKPRNTWLPDIHKAIGSRAEVSGVEPVTALKAFPTSTGTSAAKAALPVAPTISTSPRYQ